MLFTRYANMAGGCRWSRSKMADRRFEEYFEDETKMGSTTNEGSFFPVYE